MQRTDINRDQPLMQINEKPILMTMVLSALVHHMTVKHAQLQFHSLCGQSGNLKQNEWGNVRCWEVSTGPSHRLLQMWGKLWVYYNTVKWKLFTFSNVNTSYSSAMINICTAAVLLYWTFLLTLKKAFTHGLGPWDAF